MSYMKFSEYLEKRQKNESLLLGAGIAAGAVGLGLIYNWMRKKARDQDEFDKMQRWWHSFEVLVKNYGPDSEQVQRQMRLADQEPINSLKSMAEIYLDHERKKDAQR